MTTPQPPVLLWPSPAIETVPTEKPLFRVLHSDASHRVIQVSFRRGQELQKHKVSGPVLVIVAAGEVVLSFGDVHVQLTSGMMQPISANVEHSLVANTDATVIVIRPA